MKNVACAYTIRVIAALANHKFEPDANDRYVFDIKGNQYRLIALIIFKVRTVFILFIGTHQEYNKIDTKQVSFKK